MHLALRTDEGYVAMAPPNDSLPTQEFERYERDFRLQAQRLRRSSLVIDSCLRYARPLVERGVPVIYSGQDFALRVGYVADFLYAASAVPNHFYRTFSVKKAAGGSRQISEPLPSLKEVQKWILINILEQTDVSRFAKAFVRRSSIRENARFHRGQPLVLSLDIQDFFPGVRSKKVFQIFREIGYSTPVSGLLTGLCTLNGCLPQGAPTSPALSNLALRRFDRRLSSYCIKSGLRYTRYADDITVSGELRANQVISLVKAALADEGLVLNGDKTRLMGRHQQQEVTGVVVNDRVRSAREFRREIRQAVHYIKKFGVDGHLAKIAERRSSYLDHLIGQVSHTLFLEPTDSEMKAALAFLRSEKNRNRVAGSR